MSQKEQELEKVLHELALENNATLARVHKMMARIEVVCDFEDLIQDLMKALSS